MARIPEQDIERLKEEVSVARLVESSGVGLKKSGKDLAGRCPFHEDDTASLIVTPAKNLWHCFGCQIGGGPIDWVMKARGVSFRHAVELLRADPSLVAITPAAGANEQGQVLNCNISGRSHFGSVTRYDYDAAGNIVRTTVPGGAVTRAAYDAMGRKISEVDANGAGASWQYNYFGRQLGSTDMGGRRVPLRVRRSGSAHGAERHARSEPTLQLRRCRADDADRQPRARPAHHVRVRVRPDDPRYSPRFAYNPLHQASVA